MLLTEHPHRRYNPLTGDWILVSPHRTKRPWQGRVEPTQPEGLPRYDPSCYLCPGNARASGDTNPAYTDTYVFDNDYAALLGDVPADRMDEKGLLKAETETGICRVVCFSPRHDLTLSRMEEQQIARVIGVWQSESGRLGSIPGISYVQIFENRGQLMGCSNPHPHGQIWANRSIPLILAAETARQREYFAQNGSCLLCEYLDLELRKKERLVLENDSFVALVPFWAVWPFETMILPRRHAGSLEGLDGKTVRDLAGIMRALGIRYDNLFLTNFPYSMGVHQAPAGAGDPAWHFHLHYYPPLLRSATVRKFMVGYEMLCEPQRDITAESAADRLRAAADRHYLGAGA